MFNTFLHLGTNQNDRLINLENAFSEIEKKIGLIDRRSGIYETEPWGLANQEMFLNIVIEVKTKLNPDDLLIGIKIIENEMGRVKAEKWGPRKIDIDILSYGDLIVDKENLKIPHPQIQNRNFVLIPFMELEPDLVLPGYENSIEELFEQSKDECEVYIFES